MRTVECLKATMLGIDTRAARYTWTAALVLLFLCLVYLMRTTLFVFIVALLFGYLLSPLVNVIDRLLPGKRTRTPALAIAYLIFLAVLFVVSLVLSWVRIKAHSLAASVLLHATYNFTTFATAFIASGGYRHLERLTK